MAKARSRAPASAARRRSWAKPGESSSRPRSSRAARRRALGEGGGEERGFGGRAAAAAVLDLDHLRRAEPERAAGAVEAGEVVGDELRLGAGPQAADGENRHAQAAATPVSAARGRAAACGIHIFSSW